jgi:hypothetical protein
LVVGRFLQRQRRDMFIANVHRNGFKLQRGGKGRISHYYRLFEYAQARLAADRQMAQTIKKRGWRMPASLM